MSSANLNRLVLVLNSAYEAVNVVNCKRSLTLVFSGKADVIEVSPHFIHTQHLDVQVPSVIRLKVYRRVPRHSRAVSRKSIFLRDLYCCQYCHGAFTPKELTLDHVIPRSRGGKSTWHNLVTCCLRCNNKKADRTPEEANMPLSRKPVEISIHSKHRLMMKGPGMDSARYPAERQSLLWNPVQRSRPERISDHRPDL